MVTVAAAAGRSTAAIRLRQLRRQAAAAVAVAALWQLLASTAFRGSLALPTLTSVFEYAAGHPGQLLRHTATTVKEVAAAFALAVVIGVVLGVLVHELRVLQETLLPLLVVTQVVPAVAFAPVLVVLFGVGTAPRVATATLMAFFPIVVNTVAGLEGMGDDVRDLSRCLGASRLQTLRLFSMRYAVPYVFAGARVAATLSVIGAVVGEFVTADRGLGYLVLQGSSLVRPQLVFAALLCLAVVGIAFFLVIGAIERKLLPWAHPLSW